VREPQVFLMDEPLSNLDAKLRVQTRVELTRLHGRLQSTVIYVTHDQVEAMTMGSRIAILRSGKLQQLDSPAEVYAHPANMFVAGFIGSPAMNFFAADLERRDGDVHVKAAGLDLPLPAAIVARLGSYPGSKVIVGVRPEDIHDSRRQPTGDAPSTLARIDVVEHMGNENFIYLTLGQSSFMARMDSSVAVRAGDNLPISIDTRKVHLFDPATETAILAHSADSSGLAASVDRSRTYA
jgi:multiple sugar transport system ATP-binding protein